MRNSILTARVNFSISVVFIGSVALLAIVTILEASDQENPIANYMATVAEYENL